MKTNHHGTSARGAEVVLALSAVEHCLEGSKLAAVVARVALQVLGVRLAQVVVQEALQHVPLRLATAHPLCQRSRTGAAESNIGALVAHIAAGERLVAVLAHRRLFPAVAHFYAAQDMSLAVCKHQGIFVLCDNSRCFFRLCWCCWCRCFSHSFSLSKETI